MANLSKVRNLKSECTLGDDKRGDAELDRRRENDEAMAEVLSQHGWKVVHGRVVYDPD